MKTIAVIQARMGSTRLPGKVLLKLQNKTVLEHIVERVRNVKEITKVIVATTTNPEDDAIVQLASLQKTAVYRGSEEDVLDRFYQAGKLFNADHVVRVTADCPLIDPNVINDVIKLHFQEQADYTTNTMPETFPDGEDVEIMTMNCLSIAWKKAKLLSEREHVTPYVRKNPDIFKVRNLKCETNLSQKRWTLDNKEDFEFIKIVYENLYAKNGRIFGVKEILAFLNSNKEIEQINSRFVRNEGYLKSLKEDHGLSVNKKS